MYSISMITFEEELKKFHKSVEIEDVEKTIYGQDLTDIADVFIDLTKGYDDPMPVTDVE